MSWQDHIIQVTDLDTGEPADFVWSEFCPDKTRLGMRGPYKMTRDPVWWRYDPEDKEWRWGSEDYWRGNGSGYYRYDFDNFTKKENAMTETAPYNDIHELFAAVGEYLSSPERTERNTAAAALANAKFYSSPTVTIGIQRLNEAIDNVAGCEEGKKRARSYFGLRNPETIHMSRRSLTCSQISDLVKSDKRVTLAGEHGPLGVSGDCDRLSGEYDLGDIHLLGDSTDGRKDWLNTIRGNLPAGACVVVYVEDEKDY